MSLYVDPILILMQIAPFLVIMWILNTLVFVPFTKHLEDRENATGGVLRDAESSREACAEKLAEIEQRLQDAREQGRAVRSQLRSEALQSHEAAMQQVRDEVDSELQAARTSIQSKLQEAQALLNHQAADLSDDILKRLLSAPQ